MTRKEIMDILKEHAVELEFEKADGTIRHMQATRQSSTLFARLGNSPMSDGKKEEIDIEHGNITVFDLEKDAFRSFKLTRLRKIKIIE